MTCRLSGFQVLVVGADGSVRSEVVARVKIERRPMLLVRLLDRSPSLT